MADLGERIDHGMDHIPTQYRNITCAQGGAASRFNLVFRWVWDSPPDAVGSEQCIDNASMQ
jgi:hypothetical protein